MSSYFGKSLKRRLAAGFFLVALAPVAMVATAAYILSSRTLEEGAMKQLTAVREIKKKQILSYFEDRFAEAEILLQNWPAEEDQSEEALRPLIEMNEKVLDRIKGHADFDELKARGEELEQRLLETGWALATQLIFIGRK